MSSGPDFCACGRTERQTDLTKLIRALRKFTNAPKIALFIAIYVICDYFQAYHEKGKLTVVVSVNEVP
jgi:hypothetical protein